MASVVLICLCVGCNLRLLNCACQTEPIRTPTWRTGAGRQYQCNQRRAFYLSSSSVYFNNVCPQFLSTFGCCIEIQLCFRPSNAFFRVDVYVYNNSLIMLQCTTVCVAHFEYTLLLSLTNPTKIKPGRMPRRQCRLASCRHRRRRLILLHHPCKLHSQQHQRWTS